MFCDVTIEGKEIKGLLDTGASVTVLAISTRLSKVKTASGQYHRVIGKVNVSIRYKNQ